ncbi:MAG: ABC transporter permease [Candidatus Nomurabacteria bacterium]|jgi:putative ABC transport system permease protein|nr:ABC transporter permease [Candidatus Nomurabacteria bacterium]
MKLWDIIKTTNSNLLRNKGRSFLTILAILIGSFTIIMTTGINTGVNGYIDRQMESAGGEGYLEIMTSSVADLAMSSDFMGGGDVKEYNPEKDSSAVQYITNKDIEKMRQVKGVESVKQFNALQAEYITRSSSAKKYAIQVSEMPTNSINIDMASGRIVNLSSDVPEIAIPDKFVSPLGFKNKDEAVGQKVKIAVMNQITQRITEHEVTISGIMNASVVGMGRSWLNTAAGTDLYNAMTAGLPAEYKDQSYFAVAQLESGYTSNEKVQEIKDKFKDMGYTAMTVADEVGMIKSFFDAITTVLTIFGAIALVAASIGIVNTLFMAVQERTREIGLMKAMGLGKGKIFTMFSFEAISLGFWGSAIGIGLAYVARAIANSLASQTFLKDLPGFTLIEFNIISLVTVALIVMFIAFLAGTLPARRASKKDPIEALRYE